MPVPERPSDDDYESLRGFVPARTRDPDAGAPDEDRRIGVVTWLLGVGQVVVRRLKPVPPSPVARIHARR